VQSLSLVTSSFTESFRWIRRRLSSNVWSTQRVKSCLKSGNSTSLPNHTKCTLVTYCVPLLPLYTQRACCQDRDRERSKQQRLASLCLGALPKYLHNKICLKYVQKKTYFEISIRLHPYSRSHTHSYLSPKQTLTANCSLFATYFPDDGPLARAPLASD